jgi:hypothetical protein
LTTLFFISVIKLNLTTEMICLIIKTNCIIFDTSSKTLRMKSNYFQFINTILICLMFAFFYFFFQPTSGLNTVTISETIDTTFIKKELERLVFDNVAKAANVKTVYVPEKLVERYYNDRESINNYYFDSTTIVNNNGVAVKAMITNDTIRNNDGMFAISMLSPGPIFSSTLDYELNQMQITKTITQVPKNQFWIGANVGFGVNRFGFANEIQYFRNNKHGFKYGFDWINQEHRIGYLYNLNRFGNGRR